MKKAGIFILLVSLLSGLSLYFGWQNYQSFLAEPLNIPAKGIVLDVQPGMSANAVVSRLADLGVSEQDWKWKALLYLQPVVIKAGEYQLQPDLTPDELLLKLERGQVIQYSFTIVEGWSYQQLLSALKNDPILGPELNTQLENETWTDIETPWGHPEGAFLPETYAFERHIGAREILLRAHRSMLVALDDAWSLRTDDHPLETTYELLILASIIEKETALESERTQISGVFVRRLNLRMRLQTDPTVIYGLGESYDGDIKRRDLQTDTPYNTYTRHGLPPTPIAMPGKASLQAAAQPLDGDTLFFVADGEGGHAFSATLDQHLRAVNKLLGRK